MTETALTPVTRPDGRLYRPRKLRAFLLNEDDLYQDVQVLVLGTHDIAVARAVAAVAVRHWDSGYLPCNPVTGWWRQGMRDHADWFEPDERRGRAGVLFQRITEVPAEVIP